MAHPSYNRTDYKKSRQEIEYGSDDSDDDLISFTGIRIKMFLILLVVILVIILQFISYFTNWWSKTTPYTRLDYLNNKMILKWVRFGTVF